MVQHFLAEPILAPHINSQGGHVAVGAPSRDHDFESVTPDVRAPSYVVVPFSGTLASSFLASALFRRGGSIAHCGASESAAKREKWPQIGPSVLTRPRAAHHPPPPHMRRSAAKARQQGGNHEQCFAPRRRAVARACLAPAVRAEPPKLPVPAVDQSAVAQRGYFYVGGKYAGEPGKDIMDGQTYVEVLAPKEVRRPYPLVLIHGAAQTATNWMGTPDGRKGWAEYFVEQGYIVYMIDQPMRGRSAAHPPTGRPACSRPRTRNGSSPPVDREHLAAGQAAHAMAGRRPQQGPEGRSGVRRLLCHPGRDRHFQ